MSITYTLSFLFGFFALIQAQSQCAHLDIIFLVDESQNMLISNGFGFAKNFIGSVADSYAEFPDVRFAWVGFNSKIWVQTPFTNARAFKANVSGTDFNVGDSNWILGFDAVINTMTMYSGGSRTSALIFISDGLVDDGGSISAVVAKAKIIRCQLNTTIIGLGIDEGVTGANTIKNAIGVGTHDECLISYYDDMISASLPEIQQYVNCFETCNLDIIFVFENSELVNSAGRKLELGAIAQTLADYTTNHKLNYSGDHIGVVFFSSKDGFNGAEFQRSGILIDPANSNPASYLFPQAVSLLENFESKYRWGGASDSLLGLNMTYLLLSKRRQIDGTSNIPAIILMGRGTFHDGDNCCDSPVAFAQMLRANFGAQMKGVLVGRLSNGNIMSSITGTTNIVPTNDYYNDGSAFVDGKALATQIDSWLESVRRNSSCPLQHKTSSAPHTTATTLPASTTTMPSEGANNVRPCSNTTANIKLDLIFALDSSQAVGSDNYQTFKRHLAGLIQLLTINQNGGSRIGFIYYAEQANIWGNLTTYNSTEAAAASLLTMPYLNAIALNMKEYYFETLQASTNIESILNHDPKEH